MAKKRYYQSAYAHIKQGWLTVGSERFYSRSGYEESTAYYLEYLKQEGQLDYWKHEDLKIRYPLKSGTLVYIPDFSCYKNGQLVKIIEVKGRLMPKDITKIKRLKKYFPSLFAIFTYIGSNSYTSVVKSEYKVKEVIDIKDVQKFAKYYREKIDRS